MKTVNLSVTCRAEMDCPKEIVMWNYYDHEHLVGTHYKLYDHARVLAQRDDWALVYRGKKMPFLPFWSGGMALQYMEGNVMKTFHQDQLGFLLEMEVEFEDLPDDRCRITATYNIITHPIFKVFEPVFKALFRKWFWATWEEDAPMRLRRWKVHKLGFKDFSGIDYINECLPEPRDKRVPAFEFRPPISCLKAIKSVDGERRRFAHSTEVGYNDD